MNGLFTMNANANDRRSRPTARRGAFTLIELMVVIGIVGVLCGMLLPGLGRVRGQGRAAVCQSNIRQLGVANGLYAFESAGAFVPGAADFAANLHRWHGRRAAINQPFTGAEGPLVPYLGEDAAVRACPDFEPDPKGFEVGNGGYGYNNAYVGVQTARTPQGRDIVIHDRRGATADRIRHPGETVMFADSAFAAEERIEYSFAEPRFHPQFAARADPSIHFRHARTAHVTWCDGHISAERRTFTWSSGMYRGDPDRLGIGWFGQADDNSLFDLR